MGNVSEKSKKKEIYINSLVRGILNQRENKYSVSPQGRKEGNNPKKKGTSKLVLSVSSRQRLEK